MSSSKMKPCPVCGFTTLRGDRDYSVCAVCNWEDDPIQADDPDFWGGANKLSLNDYRKAWTLEHHRSADNAKELVAV